MNNKGFMMAEVVVVSSIILIFLAGLYKSYNKMFAAYQKRVGYYDATALYDLAYYRDRLIVEKNGTESKMNRLLKSSNYYLPVIGSGANQVAKLNYSTYGNDNYYESVYLVHNAKHKMEVGKLPTTISDTFKEYIDYLSTSIEFKANYIMLMERCSKVTIKKKDASGTTVNHVEYGKCKYAYLEVYDGKE